MVRVSLSEDGDIFWARVTDLGKVQVQYGKGIGFSHQID